MIVDPRPNFEQTIEELIFWNIEYPERRHWHGTLIDIRTLPTTREHDYEEGY